MGGSRTDQRPLADGELETQESGESRSGIVSAVGDLDWEDETLIESDSEEDSGDPISGRVSHALAPDYPPIATYGRYEILGRLAVGGMAEVFLARELGSHNTIRHVAIKRILPQIADDETFVEMFLDEARLAVQLNHPNICHIYDFGEIDETYFIAMEWVNGIPWGKLVKRARDRSGIPISVVSKVIAHIAEALHHAHQARDGMGRPMNIVHRDVSPQNIMVRYDGVVKLLDFGIAKNAAQTSQTAAGVVKGKFSYMAPEQCLGRPLDARTDIFALGACLYESLTGVAAFRRSSDLDTMRAIVHETPTAISRFRSDVPDSLQAIVDKALEKDPRARFQTAGDLYVALERFLAAQGEFVRAMHIAQYIERLLPGVAEAGPLRESHTGSDALQAASSPSLTNATASGGERRTDESTVDVHLTVDKPEAPESVEEISLRDALDFASPPKPQPVLLRSPAPAAGYPIVDSSLVEPATIDDDEESTEYDEEPPTTKLDSSSAERRASRRSEPDDGPTERMDPDELVHALSNQAAASLGLSPSAAPEGDSWEEASTNRADLDNALTTKFPGSSPYEMRYEAYDRQIAQATTGGIRRRWPVVPLALAVILFVLLVAGIGVWLGLRSTPDDDGAPTVATAPIPASSSTAPDPATPRRTTTTPLPSSSPAPTTGSLIVTSSPAGATVVVAGRTGRTPTTFNDLPPGNHPVVVSKAGHIQVRETAIIRAGNTVELPVTLPTSQPRTTPAPPQAAPRPAPREEPQAARRETPAARRAAPPERPRATSRAASPERPPARRRRTRTPRRRSTMTTASRMRAPEPRPAMSEEPTPRAERPAERPTGTLTLLTEPSGARVYIGGRALGRTPLRDVRVPAGTLRLRLVDAEGRTHLRSIRIEAGQSQPAFLQLGN